MNHPLAIALFAAATSLELLTWLTTRIHQLDAQIAAAAAADAQAQRRLTHPGVGR